MLSSDVVQIDNKKNSKRFLLGFV